MAGQTSNWITMAYLASPLIQMADRRFKALPELPVEIRQNCLPSLSIIIPARNEEPNLKVLLPSLNKVTYPGRLEVIVVDDRSTDLTSTVAEGFGARVVKLDGVAAGWTGKSHASHQGALASSGKWLLFTDADTIHQTHGPGRAVSYAISNELDGLSIFIKQKPFGLLDGAALSAAFVGLFSGLKEGSPFINGQYILLKRDIYMESGGFSMAQAEPLEDLALGYSLRQKAYIVPLLRSEDAASVQMYRERPAFWNGMSRIGAGSLPWLGLRSVITILVITAVMSPILALSNALRTGRQRILAVSSWLVISLSFLPWARRFGSVWLAFLAPIGAFVVQLAAIWGLLLKLFGQGTKWKGRRV